MQIEKLKDSWGDLVGYKLGEYYLMKYYTWGNNYSWIINKDGRNHYPDYSLNSCIESGEVETVGSFKEGKSILISRYKQ